MSRARDYLAARAAWRQYGARLTEADQKLDRMEAAGADPASAEYSELWHDRMGFAANCYPDAPEPDLGDPGYHLLTDPEPQAGECPEPEAGA